MPDNDLISRSALKKELAPQDDWSWANGAYVRDMIDAAPTVELWISVKDRLPEDEYECLVITKDCWCYIGWYKCDIQKWVVDGVVWRDETITHWIKLPEPPKEDEEYAGQ